MGRPTEGQKSARGEQEGTVVGQRIVMRVLAVAGFLVAWMNTDAPAAESPNPGPHACSVAGIPTTRPGDADQPTEVTIGVRMADLDEIDDVGQTLTTQLFIRQRWTDQRLARLAGCEIPVSDVWSPRIGFVNSGRMFPTLPEVVEVGANGTVTYLQDFFGTLASYESLQAFPFDDHVFSIWLTSASYSTAGVILGNDEEFTGRRDLLNISDWVIGDVHAQVVQLNMHATNSDHSVYQFLIPAERIKVFYIVKIFVPLVLIVIMSWAVFWLNPANFGPQIGLSATSMLTLIAFLFATTNMVPRLGYLTTLDLFIIAALALVFLALLESLAASYLVAHQRLETAQRLDRVSRVLFPAAFVMIILGILVL